MPPISDDNNPLDSSGELTLDQKRERAIEILSRTKQKALNFIDNPNSYINLDEYTPSPFFQGSPIDLLVEINQLTVEFLDEVIININSNPNYLSEPELDLLLRARKIHSAGPDIGWEERADAMQNNTFLQSRTLQFCAKYAKKIVEIDGKSFPLQELVAQMFPVKRTQEDREAFYANIEVMLTTNNFELKKQVYSDVHKAVLKDFFGPITKLFLAGTMDSTGDLYSNIVVIITTSLIVLMSPQKYKKGE